MSTPNQDFEIDEAATRTITIPLTSNGSPYAVPGGAIVSWWAAPSQFIDQANVPIKKSNASGVSGLSIATVGGQTSVSIFLYGEDTLGRGQTKMFHQASMNSSDGITPLFSGIMTINKRLAIA